MPNWTDTAPVVDVPCPFGCTEGERREIVSTVWEAPDARIYQCSNCDIVFLHPIMSEEEEREFYESQWPEYMKERGAPGETNPREHYQGNYAEGERRLANLMPFLRPDMRVLELGAASAFLLDLVRPHVAEVTGIEPGPYRPWVEEEIGIEMFGDLAEVEAADRRFDLILAYYVVEHLRDPVADLRRLHDRLAPGGLLAIEVPNVNDALVRLYAVEAFDRFYWQRAHYFVYSHETLADVLKRAGFVEVQSLPEQRYDISNHLHWLATGKPGGKGKYAHLFDERVNAEYTRALREHWLCDTVFAVAKRTDDA